MASILKHLLHPSEPQTAQDIASGPFDVRILGHTDFVVLATGALELIRADCPDLYKEVLDNVAVIQSTREGSARHHEEPPRITLESNVGYGRDLPARSRVVWYAGAIVHQAWHSKLFRDYRVRSPEADWPTDEVSARERDNDCLRVQHDALTRMGAPQWMLDYVGSMIGVGAEDRADRRW